MDLSLTVASWTGALVDGLGFRKYYLRGMTTHHSESEHNWPSVRSHDLPAWRVTCNNTDMRSVSELISSGTSEQYSYEGFTALAAVPGLIRIECSGHGTKLLGVLLAVVSNQHVVRVLFLVVQGDYQRRGLGRKAWRMLLDWASQRRLDRIELHVRRSNSQAISFYTALGLSVERRIPKFYEAEDALEMSMSLDECQSCSN